MRFSFLLILLVSSCASPPEVTPWAGHENRTDPAMPPSLWVFPPDQKVEVEFEISHGARGFVDVWVDVTDGPTRFLAEVVREKENTTLVRGALPGRKEGTLVEYEFGARLGEEETRWTREWRNTYFVTSAPTSLKDVPEEPHPVKKKMHPSPENWRDQSIYFLIPDRFSDEDPNNNRMGYCGYAPKDPVGAHGGDFLGVTRKLDYLKGLGVTTLWIAPVPQNFHTYHGYGAIHFMMPDRRLGTMAELRTLVEEAHRRGLYVILDIVVNHSADLIHAIDGDDAYSEKGRPQQFYYESQKKVLPLPVELRNPAWYHNHGTIDRWDDFDAAPSHTRTGHLIEFDDFKTESAEVRRAMIKIYRWWIAQTDVDGFRVDTVKHVEPEFWQEFCPAIRTYAKSIGKANFLMVGEFLTGAEARIAPYTGTMAGGKYLFDGMLQFPMFGTMVEVFREGRATHLLTKRKAGDLLYHDALLNVLFLDSHDVPRFLSQGKVAQLKVALGYLFTSGGIPSVYYGTEQGFAGGMDPANREDLFEKFDTNHEIYRWIARLSEIRKKSRALRRGTFLVLEDNQSGAGVFAFTRRGGEEDVFVVLNTAAETKTTGFLPLDSGRHALDSRLVDLLGEGAEIRVGKGAKVQVTLPGQSIRMYR